MSGGNVCFFAVITHTLLPFTFHKHNKIVGMQRTLGDSLNKVNLLTIYGALPRRNQNHISTRNERRQMVWNFKRRHRGKQTLIEVFGRVPFKEFQHENR